MIKFSSFFRSWLTSLRKTSTISWTTPFLVCFQPKRDNYSAVNLADRHLAKCTDDQHIILANLRNKPNRTSALGKTDKLLCTIFARKNWLSKRLTIVFDPEPATGESGMPIDETFYLNAELFCKMSIRLPMYLMLNFCSLTNWRPVLAISALVHCISSSDQSALLQWWDWPIFVRQLRSEVPSYADTPKQFCSMVNLKREKVYYS